MQAWEFTVKKFPAVGVMRFLVHAKRAFPVGVYLATTAVAAAQTHPLESADTSSPQAIVQSFKAGLQEIDRMVGEQRRLSSTAEHESLRYPVFRRLHMSELPPAVRSRLAKDATVYLSAVSDRIGSWIVDWIAAGI